MVEVKPFRAVRYDPEKVSMEKVVAPPYDIISEEEKENLHRRSEHNIARVDSAHGEGKSKYLRAKELLEGWMKEEVLVEEEKPCFYYYTQDYTFNGRKKRLSGFLGLLRLEEFGEKVFAHEHTMKGPKKDRLELMRQTRSNLSPVYTVYQDEEKIIEGLVGEEGVPLYSFSENFGGEEITHTLWKLSSRRVLNKIPQLMRDKKIFIADGHHRYETALGYKKESNNPAADYTLTFFTNFDKGGITVISSHRLVHSSIGEEFLEEAEGYFTVEKCDSREEMLEKVYSGENSFGFFGGGNFYLLKLRSPRVMDELIQQRPRVWKTLDVVILHHLIIGKLLGIEREENHISYRIDAQEAQEAVERGEANAAFFLKPPSLKEIRDVSFAGEKMPGKSTYFFPKLLTGLVLYTMD